MERVFGLAKNGLLAIERWFMYPITFLGSLENMYHLNSIFQTMHKCVLSQKIGCSEGDGQRTVLTSKNRVHLI
jgi:hypothetical protein